MAEAKTGFVRPFFHIIGVILASSSQWSLQSIGCLVGDDESFYLPHKLKNKYIPTLLTPPAMDALHTTSQIPKVPSSLAMDTLSSSVSTFKIPSIIHPKSHELHHVRNHLLPRQQLISVTKTSAVSNKSTTTFATHSKNPVPPFVASSQRLKQQSSIPEFHQKATTGYAVALLDAARCKNVIGTVERDVNRLSKWLSNEQLCGVITDPFVEVKAKGEMLEEVVGRGKFHKHLVKLVNLLVEKNKMDILSEVLIEFRRICDELYNNTQVVLVSSGVVKMDENQVLGIAKRVQKLTGAAKVKVRKLVVDQKSPLFAV